MQANRQKPLIAFQYLISAQADTDFEESQAHENFRLFTVQECIIRSVIGTCVRERP